MHDLYSFEVIFLFHSTGLSNLRGHQEGMEQSCWHGTEHVAPALCFPGWDLKLGVFGYWLCQVLSKVRPVTYAPDSQNADSQASYPHRDVESRQSFKQ